MGRADRSGESETQERVVPEDVTWTSDTDEYHAWVKRWEPYISGPETPGGEIPAHCPIHEDKNPSAQLNLYVGAWKCYSCGESGYFASSKGDQLAYEMDERDDVPGWVTSGGGYSRRKTRMVRQMPSVKQIKAWSDALFSHQHVEQRAYLVARRKLSEDVLRERLVGYFNDERAYTIPLLSASGEILNVKFRAQHVNNKSMWTVTGASTHVLWPEDALEPEALEWGSQDLYIVEGEMDVLAAETMGLRAITSAGGAHGKWDASWSRTIAQKLLEHSPDANVWVVPDFDDAGEAFASRVVASLRSVGLTPRVVRLPYQPGDKENEGADLNDLLIELRDPNEARSMLARAIDEAVGSGDAERLADEAASDPKSDDRFERLVSREVDKIHVRREAERRQLDAEAARTWTPLDGRTLARRIDDGVPEVSFRIDSLIPTGGNTLLVGPEKAGKTTLMGNLMGSLVTGDPFLGEFRTTPVSGNVVMFNYEVGETQWLNWLDEMGLTSHGDRIIPVTLRGQTVDLRSSFTKEQVVRFLQEHEAEVWIPDPYARAYGGEENDNSEVGAWLELVDEVKERAGVSEVILATHSGRGDSPRARGAQRLEDWPDAIWHLTRDASGVRAFSAYGRDVMVDPPRKLAWEPDLRRMSIDRGMTPLRDGEAAEDAVMHAVGAAGMDTAARVTAFLGEQGWETSDVMKAVRRLVRKERLSKQGQGASATLTIA